MTAGVDLALAMVEADLGADLAREVARALVVYHRRGGGQSQFSMRMRRAFLRAFGLPPQAIRRRRRVAKDAPGIRARRSR
ncbi:MAG: transcriptional regulator, AraC-family [Myxococcaceae bacterium]|nr:transcriptional regulator, AraC-family [Myxococcaceae bacterium]